MPISAASYEMLRDAVQVKDGFHLGRLQSWLDSIEEEVERPQPHKQQKKGHRHRRNLSVRIPVEALPSLNQGRSAGSLSSPEPRSYISAQLETPINGDNNGPLTSPMIRIHLTPATPASEPDHDEYFDALEWISAGHDTISAAESPSAETIRLQNQRSFNDNQGRSAAFFYCTATSSRHYQDHEDSAEPEPVQAWVFDRPINTWVRPALLVHDQDSNTDDACSDDSESLVLGSKDEQASADVLEQRVQTSLKETRLRQLGVNELLDTDNKESTAMLEQQACELEMFLKEDWLEQRQISDLIESIDREVEADALLEQSLFDDLDASYRWRAKIKTSHKGRKVRGLHHHPNDPFIGYDSDNC